MRLCASLFQGVAAPLGCVIFFASAEIAVCTPCTQGFPYVRKMGGITTLGALYVLLKLPAPACQKGQFAVSFAVSIGLKLSFRQLCIYFSKYGT